MNDAVAIRPPQPSSLARRDELTIEDMLAQVQKVQQVMAKVMKDGEHYGVIPGTGSKPSLLKPGAEKLCMLFRLDPQYTARETVDGKHLTIETTCTLYHIPSGERWGSGMGSCSTKESKYAYRQSKRACPKCGAEQINKSKFPMRNGSPPGWYCHAKGGGCGAEFSANDPQIMGQETGRRANEDLADQYNTVLKMANKRALVAAVLNVTAASDIFTQDLEDLTPAGGRGDTGSERGEEPPQSSDARRTEGSPQADRGSAPLSERQHAPASPAEVLFPTTPAETDQRADLVGDFNRLVNIVRPSSAQRLDLFATHLGERTSAALAHCTIAQLTSLVNALREQAGEPMWAAA